MQTRAAIRRLWPLTKGDRHWILIVCCCVVLAALAETAAILLFSQLTDDALEKGSLSAFWGPAGKWLGASVAGAVVGYVGNVLAAWVAERFVLRLRARVFSHVQSLPPHFFQQHRQGDLVERLTGDVEAIEQLAVSGLVQIVSAFVSVVCFGAAALWLRWDLALATFLLAPLFLLCARRLSQRVKSVAQQERAADGAITSVVTEALGSVQLTQAYDRQHAEDKRLRRHARTWMRASVRGARFRELYEQSVEVVETLCVLAVTGLGVWEISAGRMTLGQLLAFAAFLGYLYPPIRSLGQVGLNFTEATAGAERLHEILTARPAVTDPERPLHSSGRAHGRLSLHDVTFHYPTPGADSNLPALSGISLAASPGELVVVTGPSGAGKSTLAQLLLRFYDPDEGTVCLDGEPLHSLTLAYVRRNITLLPQQTAMLRGTVRDNIACGRLGATDEEVVQAATDADAHAFISALPEGYATELDPHAMRLSGGQLQRIALARAMLRDSPVLVLDEPTTGLDVDTAHRLLAPLRRLATGRTTLVISHDPLVAAEADRVLALNGGRLQRVSGAEFNRCPG